MIDPEALVSMVIPSVIVIHVISMFRYLPRGMAVYTTARQTLALSE